MNKLAIVLTSFLLATVAPVFAAAQGDAAAGQAKAALCGSCHGVDGNSALAMNPKLAGQGAGYLYKSDKSVAIADTFWQRQNGE